MRSGRTAGKRFIPKQFIDYYDSPYTKQVEVAKALAQSKGGITAQDLMDKSGVSKTSVRKTLINMHRARFIHISHWVKLHESGYVAAYSVGSKDDVAKPLSQRAVKEARRREEQEKTPAVKLADYYQALANALVPKRKPEEQRKVNNLYLNWISGGEYEHG